MPLRLQSWPKWPLVLLVVCGATVHAQSGGERALDLDAFWHQPLASQRKPPAQWSPVEGSLAPADCGQCHAEIHAQWQTSRHAHAFSPGLVAQILTYDAAETAECLQCHATLAEQREAFEAARERGLGHRSDAQGLAAAGNSCGGCHLRDWRHYGPPQRETGSTGASALPAPHGGVFRSAAFEQAEFCSTCHQLAADTAINGKPLQNTYAEWRASPQAAQKMVCQTCHMPDRAHLWRGIHDPAMVAKGLTPQFQVDAQKARFEIANTGVGHAFPTYAVARVVMQAVALDRDGSPQLQTLRSYVIARRMRYEGNGWVELSDTRLLPGRSAAIELAWNGSNRIRVWLDIIPDDFYAREVFPGLIQTLQGQARELAVQAQAAATVSPFRLYETELRRP